MDQRRKQIEQAESDTRVAGTRAATFLSILLQNGYIPHFHEAQAREIVEAHRSSSTRWESLVWDKPVADFRVGDVVRRSPELASWLKADPETEGRVWEVSHRYPELVNVAWKDGTSSGGIHVSNIKRVA